MSDVSLGQAHEAEVTLSKAGATVENFWNPISRSDELARKVVALVAEALKMVFKLASVIDRDMTGWKCVEPVNAEEGEFEFSLQDFLQGNETYPNGEEMVKRGRKQGANSGLKHIEAIIREQDKIPVEMRKFVLVSTEIWLSPGGDRGVWYACWDGGRWVLHCGWLFNGFRSGCRLVVPRKYQK